MIKIHYQDDQENLLAECGGHMSALISTERGVKSAASDLIDKDTVERFRPPDSHFLVHCIAMGDQETYGPNKNGDGWPKEGLARKHQTFVSNGHFFREHRNRDPKQKIGDIKYAAYKPVSDGGMGRVELLMWGDKEKAAEEYEMAKEGKELCFSMSARVPEDVCSCCRKRSKSASEYCSHLRHHALQYIKEFQKYAYAENPDPDFFDNSRVRNPAERIARYIAYKFPDKELQKAASEQMRMVTGTEWAEYEGVLIPDIYMPSGHEGRFLSKLAAAEAWIPTAQYGFDKRATFAVAYAPFALMDDISDKELDELRSLRPGTLFRELAKRACVMSFPTFAAYATNEKIATALADPAVVHAGIELLPKVFTKLASEGCQSDLLSTFSASSEFVALTDESGNRNRPLLDKVATHFGIDAASVSTRIDGLLARKAAGTFEDMTEGEAERLFQKVAQYKDISGKAAALAESYGHYQLAALADIERLRGSGSVDDPEITLIAGSNCRMIYR